MNVLPIGLTFPADWAKKCLEWSLQLFGLLAPKTPSSYHRITATLVITLSACALTYETIFDLNWFLMRKKDSQLVTIVNRFQYMIKDFFAMVILIMFWRKSITMASMMKELSNGKNSQRSDEEHTENWITGTTLSTFVLCFISGIAFRVSRIITEQSSSGDWPLVDFPLLKINVMQEQILLLFARSLTDAIPVLCSGYLALILCRLRKNFSVQSRLELLALSKNKDRLSRLDLERGWNMREEALTWVATIEKELGLLLAFIICSDILAIYSVLTNFLLTTTIIRFLRNATAALLHLVSIFNIAIGLICLMDEVSVSDYFILFYATASQKILIFICD
jgi:hypothetical protein